MRKPLFVILILLLIISGCGKDDPPPTSGTETIDNTIYQSDTYYSLGFSFSQATQISNLADPGPDITLYINADNPASPRLTFQANNFKPSFYKLGDFPDAASAKAAFDNLKNIGAYQYSEMADPVSNNQVWVYRSGTDTYAKIRIISTKNEQKPDLPYQYGECTFEWLYQPDGSLTFPEK